ncbi:MAG: prenyltransferase [Polyangiaceae bacterium]|nr:prenyltransferase [Polyangiaceae bacterium]
MSLASARSWLQAARPLAAGNLVPPLVFGASLAAGGGDEGSSWGVPFSWGGLALALGFGLLDQLFIVFTNDTADAEADAQNQHPTWASGGSRVIPEGRLSRAAVGFAAGLSALLLMGYGLAAARATGRLAWLGLTAAAIGLLVAYSLPPLRLSYRGHGEWLQGLGVGGVLPLVGFTAQGAPWTALSPLSLLGAVLLGYAGNLTTSIPDHAADVAANKRSYAARRGPLRATRDSALCITLAALTTPLVVPDASIAHAAAVAFIACALVLPSVLGALRGKPVGRHVVLRHGAAISALFLGWAALGWLS